MVPTFRHLLQETDPVLPTTPFGAVLARFETDAELDILPVVFERTLLGSITRAVALALAAGPLPREQLLDEKIGRLIDEAPATVDADVKIGGYSARSATGDAKALTDGVIVLDRGAYSGTVPARALACALALENARRARAQKDMAETLRTARQKQKTEIANQAEFQAVLAHELRTPLNAVQASADLLEQHTSSSDGRLLARTVAEACESLDRLLDDLMDVSRSDMGNLPVTQEPLSLKRLTAEFDALWRPRCQEKGLIFAMEVGKFAAERIESDPSRLRQLVNNLMSNAIRYTDEGGVTLAITTVIEDEALRLDLSVSDTGPGLSGEALQTIFRPFSRLERHGDTPGTGLGLTVTKAVAESMGGQISYQASHGGGSQFLISIPVEKAGPRIVSDTRQADARPAGRLTRFELGDLLLVDDHEPSRIVLAKALIEAGWKVDGVASLTQALRRAAHKPYQAILCDLHLLDGDGSDVLRAVRRGECQDPMTPVIAVTADRSPARLAACERLGFDAVWTKPIRPREAVMELADLLSGREVQDSGTPAPRRANG